MTTEYFIKGGPNGDSEAYFSGCFGSSNRHLQEYLLGQYPPPDRSEQYNLTRRAVGKISALEFWFPVGVSSVLGKSGQRTPILQQFDELWKPLCGESCRYEYSSGGRDINYIVFDWYISNRLMVSAASCLRQYAWQGHLAQYYHELAEVGKEFDYDIHPMVRYAIASGCGSVDKEQPSLLKKDTIQLRAYNSHMQIPHYYFGNVEDIRWAKGWTEYMIRDGRTRTDKWGNVFHRRMPSPSIRENIINLDGFDYRGRDAFMVGRESFKSFPPSGRSWIKLEAKTRNSSWITYPKDQPTESLRPSYFNPIPHRQYPTIKLREMIEDLVIDEEL